MAQATYKVGGSYGVGNSKKPNTYSSSVNSTGQSNANTAKYNNPLSTYGVSNTTASNTKTNSQWAQEAIARGNANTYALNRLNTGSSPSGGSVSTSSDGGGYSGGNYSASSDDIIAKIKALLDEQKKASDEYAKSLYEQTLAQNKQAYQGNQRQANLNYMRGDRYLKSLYGDAISGQGLSNRARNNANWQNSLSSIRQNWTNNDATARASYNANLANNASTLAQGWYNYVLPVYTNRQTQLDNLDYRKYLASL